ncbi:MAG: tetratricopeptide repeat protein [Lentimicrobium sp.]|jgi:TolA-binding protein|nr:tetratricopeptide repeat protein [Lentimicrobium sp.]
MIKFRFVFYLSLFTVFYSDVFAQQSSGIENTADILSISTDLFAKEKYGATRNYFTPVLPASDLLQDFDVEKDYFISASAAELQHGDADFLLKDFLEKYPENTRTNRTWLRLGNLYFRNNSYSSALDAYENVDRFDLNQEENAEFTFKMGYCHLRKKDMNEAMEAFAAVKDQQTRYTGPATYYYAHIMYENGMYETALRDFERIQNDVTFKSVVPYYIIQIYYLQGRYDEMMEMARPFLSGATNKRTNEILRLAADVSYRRGDYAEAIRLMENYRKVNRNKVTREEDYVLGYAYYLNADYPKAIEQFQQVTGPEDSLSQNAYYHLGDCYLKINQKQFASNAFLSAWKVPVRTPISEDALFNYAKLSIELSYDPYNEAIKALQEYLVEYPSSPRRDEAYTHLANLYLVTKNYREALETFENVKKRDGKQKEIYQKISYFRALELFADKQYTEAIGLFKGSLENKVDENVTAGATYWMAEAYYRLGQYDQALSDFRAFYALPGASKQSYFALVPYNMGYVRLKQNNYAEAGKEFSKFIDSRSVDQKLLNDARLRLADAYFMQKQYAEAVAAYDQAINAKIAESDYALFQKGLAVGVSGNVNGKITTMQRLSVDYPRSQYNDDARFEMGQAQMSLGRNPEALQTFLKLATDYPNSSFVKRALLNSGLIYYNTSRETQALEMLKKVVADYPASSEAREGLAIIRNIYVDMNKVDDYVKYAQNIPFANVSQSEQDSLTYQAIENRYMNGDCQKAAVDFAGYLNRFPNGIFSVNAYFYKADCDSRAGKYDEALEGYNKIIERPRTRFTENALLKAADILYGNKDYSKALRMYERLEENAENPANMNLSLLGQMRCNSRLGNHGIAIQQAQRLQSTERLTPDMAAETQLAIGNASLELQRYDMARTAFEKVIQHNQGEMAAEALYGLSLAAFRQKDYKTAEENVFKLSSDYASYDYWVAKSFILLADVYLETGNEFQARQTLQSIVDNYEGKDLKQLAIDKLEILNRSSASKPSSGSSFDDDEGIQIK